MTAAGRNGLLVPHMRPCALHRHDAWIGNIPPSKRIYFLGLLRMCVALKTLQCCGDSLMPERFEGHTHPQPPKTLHLLARGLQTIRSKHRRGAQGLIWGARGPFPPAVPMVVTVVMPVVLCNKATENFNKNTKISRLLTMFECSTIYCKTYYYSRIASCSVD
jgi:hypothetical protein